jgi:hypothetical protein
MSKLQKVLLSLLKASLHSFDRILWEFRVSYNHLMELISQKICTLRPTMTVIYRKKRAPGPEIDLFKLGLYDVQNNRDSIFIVVPNHALVRVSSISDHHSVLL